MNTTGLYENDSYTRLTGLYYNASNYTLPNGMHHVMPQSDEVEEFLYTYVCPVFVCIGFLTNAMACYALCKPPLSNFSPSVYLTAYTLSSILCLFMSIGMQWSFDMLEQPHFQLFSESSCRIWQFVYRVVTYSGEWFLVGSAVDRFIALWFPRKSQDMCTVFMAKASLTFILIGMTVVSIHALWMTGLYFDHNYRIYHCTVNIKIDKCTLWWLWVSGLSYGLVPQTLVFLFGNLLIFRMCLKHRGRQIPETVSVETDLTNSVVISLFVNFWFSAPATIINLYLLVTPQHQGDPNAYYIARMTSYLNFFSWLSYASIFFILIGCSKPFRDNLKGLFIKCRSGAATVELQMLTNDYDEVPSSSTIL